MAYYHGTAKKNIKVLRPQYPIRAKTGKPDTKQPRAVYFSKEIYGPEMYALIKGGGSHIGISYTTSRNKFEGGVVVGKGFNLAKKGYIYTPERSKGIIKNPKASNEEYLSHDPVHAVFYKEVNRQEVLGRGWKVYNDSRFPNGRMTWETLKLLKNHQP